ncbi:probable malonyl-CoA-acyl carrier protein transacylase, mitochondrial [Diabrotica virgifera virgifera]|uniref:Malonyl-CoA:ACP transacylase (MAT) domain-containing protein n=1 Tax=Diabrotica virgifera virgifera TaxID=50390 RepID=A0ABM5JSP1_DIAVI|nr:probable malonyl-CoA-acyl carrier protein transacylase, mitochondrial [Diabrotica virgifera virgifera]
MAKDLFELANYILGYDLLKLCLQGPKDKLDQTKYCQPAVMVASLAAIEQLKEERPNAIANCMATAGFSLGQITALVFAGALGFERALQLVKIRGEAMQLAGEAYKGGMATVKYGPDSKLNQACIKAAFGKLQYTLSVVIIFVTLVFENSILYLRLLRVLNKLVKRP